MRFERSMLAAVLLALCAITPPAVASSGRLTPEHEAEHARAGRRGRAAERERLAALSPAERERLRGARGGRARARRSPIPPEEGGAWSRAVPPPLVRDARGAAAHRQGAVLVAPAQRLRRGRDERGPRVAVGSGARHRRRGRSATSTRRSSTATATGRRARAALLLRPVVPPRRAPARRPAATASGPTGRAAPSTTSAGRASSPSTRSTRPGRASPTWPTVAGTRRRC